MRIAEFKPESRVLEGGRRKRVQVVRCACGAVHEFNVNTDTRGGMSTETIVRKAILLGWESRRQGREMVCPDCSAGLRSLIVLSKMDADAAQVRAMADQAAGHKLTDAEFSRAADVLRVEAVLRQGYPTLAILREQMIENKFDEVAEHATFDLREPPPMNTAAAKASPPREPSREEKRTILDKLAEVYLSEDVGYAGEWTDGKLAASLSVPAKWVEDLRNEFHGENAGNEAGSKEARERRRQVNECRSDVLRAEAKLKDAFAAMASAETTLESCKARLGKLESGL